MKWFIMEVNLNPIVSVDLTVAILILISIIITIVAPKSKKLFHFLFIQLGVLGLFLFYLFEAISNLFLNRVLILMSGLILIPTAIFFLIGVNYIMREKVNTLTLVSICSFAVLFCVFAFLPGAQSTEFEDRFILITWDGWFKIIANSFQIIIAGIIGYWGIITWYNAPFLIKKDATLFFVGTSCLVLRVIINLLVYFHPFWILGVEFIFTFGIILFTLSMTNEPKILFILPFTLYRIMVRDKDGYPLFDHDWSKSKINEQVFTGFLNAIQLMSVEVIHLGGILEVDLKEGVLMFHESQYVTLGLVSSKNSKFLRNTLFNFIEDFEKMFENELKAKVKDPKRYEATYLLIDKYFTNFPSRLIASETEDLLLESNYLELPKQIEEKIQNVIKDQTEFKLIKPELLRAPIDTIPEFLNLYDKLSREDKEDSQED